MLCVDVTIVAKVLEKSFFRIYNLINNEISQVGVAMLMEQVSAGQECVGKIPWPDFVVCAAEGIFVDCAMARPGAVATLFGEVVKAGMRFKALDYSVLLQLLSGTAPQSGMIRLADTVVPFPLARQALYKTAKILNGGATAEYVFEQVYTEEAVLAELDFDEFVASMWLKGIRYGLQEEVVREAIARHADGLHEIALMLPPVPPQDARIEEQNQGLKRDNTPGVREDGKVDLSRFANHYPQVEQGEPLLRKVPGVPGKAGCKVTGEQIPVTAPADLDLASMVGEGTRLERRADGDYIIADMKGFLDLDIAANRISVSDKIINREGVSARTTGDLILTGENYEEMGEVQDHRVVKGYNMTFHGDVFGHLVSSGGELILLQNLAGGKLENQGGLIRVDGRVTSSVVQNLPGTVKLGRVEGSTIVGRHVVVEHAVFCLIVAETLELGVAEGCAMIARNVAVASAASRKGLETVVTLWTPGLGDLPGALEEKRARHEQVKQEMADLTGQYEQLHQRPEISHFLSLQARLVKKEIHLDAAQTASWDGLRAKLAPFIQLMASLGAQIKTLQHELTLLQQQIDDLHEQGKLMCEQSACRIDAIQGELMVQRRFYSPEQPLLQESKVEALLLELRQSLGPQAQLFFGDEGRFAWQGALD